MYARSLASSLVLALAGLFLLATPSAQAQAFVDSYYDLNQGNSIPLTAFDSSRDRVVIASLREISSFKNDIALDITIKNPFQIARTYVYTAPFLDSKNGRVEIADLVADDNAYVVFFNKSADSRTRWSSWALRLDPSNLHVVWGRQLTVSGDPDECVRVRDAVSLGTSWAMVAALDNELIDAETAVVRIDGAGTVLWSNSYALTKDAELFTLSYGPQGLVAGGWVSGVFGLLSVFMAAVELYVRQ